MYAIIDNSTLTAVQRLLGAIPIKNKYTIDGDILALETFVQSVLFYDDLFYIDDYKTQHRQSRQEFFPYVYPIEFDDESYDELMSETRKLTSEFIPEISSRTFANDELRKFFQLLKMNMTFTWDMSSSSYYLTYKLLQEESGVDIPKYSKLSTMIYSQFFGDEPTTEIENKTPMIYDSRGNLISSNYKVIDKYKHEKDAHISKQTSAFLSGLSWLDFRTTFYILAANQLGFDLVLHPIRNAYEINIQRKYSENQHSSRAIIDAMNNTANETLTNITSATQPILINSRLPMFSAWIAGKSGNLDNLIENIYSLKGEKEIIRARDILNNLDEIHREKGNEKYITDANLLIAEFESNMQKLLDRYGVMPSKIDITSSFIKAYNVYSDVKKLPKLPNIQYKVKKPTFIKKMFYHYSGFGATYKAIISDLVSIEQLGRYHDILTSKVSLDKNADYYDIKTENPSFANYKSDWKIPL